MPALFVWLDDGPAHSKAAVMEDGLSQAAAQSAAALSGGTADAHDHMILALARARSGALGEAEALMDKAMALEPRNPSILVGLAMLRRQQGRLRDAALACDAAIALAPGYADAWRERAGVLAAGGSMAASRQSYAEAARLAPADAAAHAGLAALDAREGAAQAAAEHARRALALDPTNAVAAGALASAFLATGGAENVPPLLEPLLPGLSNPSSDSVLVKSLLGDAFHRLKQFDRAFTCYAASKKDFAAANAVADGEHLTHRAFVEAIDAGLHALDTQDWPRTSGDQPPEAVPHHVFLIGYPRSGTTLAENVLASLPGVAALEERPTLVEADRAYLAGDRASIISGLAQFGALDEAGLAHFRGAYWRKVRASGVPADCTGFVDMDPLKGTRLPLIARLFPNARILIMRRDPRDIVWSCFRTNFAMASGTLEYTTLERAALHYDAMMKLTELALEKLPLATQIVPYHELVGDFEVTTRAICAFAGLEWSEAVHRFNRTAERRGVSTASAAQVRRGLYDGTRQWEPYAQWIEPVLPILAPWIEKFGYG